MRQTNGLQNPATPATPPVGVLAGRDFRRSGSADYRGAGPPAWPGWWGVPPDLRRATGAPMRGRQTIIYDAA
ncbi:hypothetical protein JOF29_000085 [Kribbella aluminosa]|uniref:Uncharacterized protein n=1 Tax=Kribbella aluminosa TaxID=416017 RepID=A0ABS4UBI1_9ACTN|nr:hypothetical protein [Kribbella aluminosa]